MRCLLMLVGISLLSLPAYAGHTPPKILMRIFVQSTGTGLSGMQAMPVSIPPDDEVIQVRTLPEVTEQELVDVRTDPTGACHFFFNHQGQVALDVVTGENQGRILVVMIDGFVVYAPTIDEELATGELIIPHRLKPDVIQTLKELADDNVARSRKD